LPEISFRSNFQPSISHAPPTHRHRLRRHVRPRLQQQLHHLQMTPMRSEAQRGASILRRAHSRQQPAPAPHPGPARVRAPLGSHRFGHETSPRHGLEGFSI
jgi:hypothetical protein